jgi:hypothetical protein
MKKFLIFSVLILFLIRPLFSALDIPEKTKSFKDRNEKWVEDLHYLIEQMPKVHKNIFHTMTKEQLEEFAVKLEKDIPKLSDNRIITEFVKLGAMIGDGHSLIQPPAFRVYPVQTYIFKDGQYVTGADEKYNDIIGMKLVGIGDKSINEVYEIMEPLVHRDNEMQIKSIIPLFMQVAEALNGTGIIEDMENAKFTFEDNEGNRKSLILKPVEFNSYMQLLHSREVPEGMVLYRSNPNKHYWFTYLEDSKTLYFQYNITRIDPKDSSAGFIKRMEDFVNTHEIDRFVVDIRNNGGGNLFTSIPFTKFIKDNPKINQRGRLFVIIGRRTFSAASYFTTSLEYRTKAIFFGEPTGASPNHYGDNNPVILPNSKIEARLSTIYWENSFPFDKRQWTAPDVTVELTSKNYFENRDPVLEAILEYKPEPVKTVVLNVNDISKITGKYEYSPDQVLEIKQGNDGLEFEIADFISSSLYPISENKFKTDIKNIELKFAKGNFDNVILDVRGTELKLKRLESGFKSVKDLLAENKYEEAVKLFRKVKNFNPNRRTVTEVNLNNLGYELLNQKNYEAAIAIFKLNVEFYPDAFNTYDSLGEAYMVMGNKKHAIKNYEKSIELNPNNENGKRMLEKLKKK